MKGLRKVLIFVAIACVGTSYGQETDAVKPCYGSLTAYRTCVGKCRDRLADARDACDWLDAVGFGGYCDIRANEEYVKCMNICYVDVCVTA